MDNRDKPGIEVLPEIHDDFPEVRITRGRGLSERLAIVRPNEVHACIIRTDGSVENLGVSYNLRTTTGLDWEAAALGGMLPVGTMAVSNACTATTYGVATTPFTAHQLQGMRIYVPVTGITTAPVYGNIGENTTSLITIDQWWTQADGTGTTPAVGNFGIIGSGSNAARFVAVTTDAGAANAADTVLASENNANSVTRALATYAHTPAATTYTQSKTWTASGTITAIHKAGMFTSGTLASIGIMVFETVLNADATLANGDQLALTWTVNI